MDKNQFTGLMLMFALLAVYFIWFAPDPPPPTIEEETPVESAIQETTEASTSIQEEVQLPSDSLIAVENIQIN